VPGIVGISTWVDFAYQKEMQLAAVRAAGTATGPINQLRTATVTLDFNLLIANLQAGRKDAAEEQVAAACSALERAGADFLVVTSGTTSTLTGQARERVSIPFLDLADPALQEAPSAPVGLLSTGYAARGGIFQAAAERRGANLLLPPPRIFDRLDAAIFGELVRGEVTDDFLSLMREAMVDLARRGAAAIILGNTDMTLAADRLQEAAPVPLIDSARAHARAAAGAAIAGRF
jgi:aspartate racemase